MAASTPIAKAGRVDELVDQMAANIDEIRKTISTLHEPGALIELCGIKEGGIDCGYYDDHNALAREELERFAQHGNRKNR
jgi:hypothetical protein